MNKPILFLEELNTGNEIDAFWSKYNSFCDLLPDSGLEANQIVSVLPNLFKKLEKNGADYKIYEAIQSYCAKNLIKGNNLYESLLNSKKSKSLSLLPCVIKGLSSSGEVKPNIKRIQDLLENIDVEQKKIGILSILNIQISDREEREKFLKYASEQLQKSIDSRLIEFFPLIAKTYKTLKKELKNWDKNLILLSEEDIIEVQIELIYALWNSIDVNDNPTLFQPILLNLIKVDTNNLSAYNILNYALIKCLKSKPKIVIDFLEKWIKHKEKRASHINIFKNLFQEFYQKSYSEFQGLITNWLNSDDPSFHVAIFEIMRDLKINNVNQLALSKEIITGLTPKDIKYVIFKILGFIYDKDLSKTLLYSILIIRIKDDEITKLISSVFKNHLIFNYYSITEYLEEKSKTATKKEKVIINSIIKKSKNYYDTVYNLPLKKEFSPSENRLKYYNKVQSKIFSKSFEENEGGFLTSLFPTVNFRTGKDMFTKYEGQYSDKMTPSLISHSTEMPRGEFIDPIGQAKQRLGWQNYKRE